MKLPVIISFQDAAAKTFEFDKLEVFLIFIKVEQKFWAEKAEELQKTKGYANPYLNVETTFQSIFDTAKSWKKDSQAWEATVFSTQIQSLNTGQLSTIHTKWIWSGQPFILACVTSTYVDFMRLEGPAKYWTDRALACRDQGKNWAGLLAVTIIIAGIIFVSLMAAWLHAYNTGLQLNTLEGAVIFAAILSLFAFAIKTLSKLTFSAFHLQRDAEEREQLTHLYLALSNDNKVDMESRNIVLQALFSRSDSGLLAGDHSPAMPSIQDAIKSVR